MANLETSHKLRAVGKALALGSQVSLRVAGRWEPVAAPLTERQGGLIEIPCKAYGNHYSILAAAHEIGPVRVVGKFYEGDDL